MTPDLAPRPTSGECEGCGISFVIPRKGPIARLCRSCRKQRHRLARSERNGVQREYVCDGCGGRFDRKGLDGPLPKWCPESRTKRNNERSSEWQRANPDRRNGAAKRWRDNNTDAAREASRKSQEKRRRETPETVKREKVRSKYRLSDRQLDELYMRSGGLCEACGIELTEGGRHKACIDHDHDTGIVRGLLCTRCNTALGMLDDSPKRLMALLRYLQQLSASNVVGHEGKHGESTQGSGPQQNNTQGRWGI